MSPVWLAFLVGIAFGALLVGTLVYAVTAWRDSAPADLDVSEPVRTIDYATGRLMINLRNDLRTKLDAPKLERNVGVRRRAS